MQLLKPQKEKLYDFEILSIDARLLNNAANKKRLLAVLLQSNNYNLSRFFVINNKKEKNHVQKFIKQNNLKAEIIKVTSPTDKAKKLLLLVMPSGKTKIEDKINAGKKIFHLGYRKTKFIDVFEPPEGVVCYKFQKIVWGSQCPFDCAYCFLQLTYRIFPYVQQYLNLDKLFQEMDKLNDKLNKPVILNSGELADSLALDELTGIANEVITKSLKLNKIKILLLSKSNKVDHLRDVPEGQAILSMSLNTSSNIKIFEAGTALANERIKALKKAANKGYEIRCRIDPIITYSNQWQQEYEELIARLLDAVSPTVITLGQPRFYPMLLNLIKKRNPKAGKYFACNSGSAAGKRKRASLDQRLKIYDQVINLINKYGNCEIALCKEDPDIFKELDLKQKICNCV